MSEVADKFIDLGIDDGPHSAYGDGMHNKMDRFKKEFTKTNFVFETKNLDIPKGNEMTEMMIDYEDPNIEEEFKMLDNDVSEINNIIHGKIKSLFQG